MTPHGDPPEMATWDGFRGADHQICGNCWYACGTNMSGESLAIIDGVLFLVCRRKTPDRWTDVISTCWCGEGRWNEPT